MHGDVLAVEARAVELAAGELRSGHGVFEVGDRGEIVITMVVDGAQVEDMIMPPEMFGEVPARPPKGTRRRRVRVRRAVERAKAWAQ